MWNVFITVVKKTIYFRHGFCMSPKLICVWDKLLLEGINGQFSPINRLMCLQQYKYQQIVFTIQTIKLKGNTTVNRDNTIVDILMSYLQIKAIVRAAVWLMSNFVWSQVRWSIAAIKKSDNTRVESWWILPPYYIRSATLAFFRHIDDGMKILSCPACMQLIGLFKMVGKFWRANQI